MSGFDEFLRTPLVGLTYVDLAHEVDRLKRIIEGLEAGQRGYGEARKRAFLELAEDLAAMTPEQRDTAIRRIIDRAQ
jgi:hypothetical protein